MCDCIQFLRSHGLKHDTSFRFVGSVEVVNELKARYNVEISKRQSFWTRNRVSILNSMSSLSVNDVSSLLTEYIRGIKGGLLPPSTAVELSKVVKKKLRSSVCSIMFTLA